MLSKPRQSKNSSSIEILMDYSDGNSWQPYQLVGQNCILFEELIQNYEFFERFFPEEYIRTGEFRHDLVKTLLPNETMRREAAYVIACNIWKKQKIVGLDRIIEKLGETEFIIAPKDYYRDHIWHSIIVFYNGIYILNNLNEIYDIAEKKGFSKDFFLDCWALVSTIHDLGYIIELADINDDKVYDIFNQHIESIYVDFEKNISQLLGKKRLPLSLLKNEIIDKENIIRIKSIPFIDQKPIPIRSLDDMTNIFGDPVNFFEILDKNLKDINLTFNDEPITSFHKITTKEKTKHRDFYIDHGIASAFILLRYGYSHKILIEKLAINNDSTTTIGKVLNTIVDWADSPEGYQKKAEVASCAIAIHNINPFDYHTKPYGNNLCAAGFKFDLLRYPLAYLLYVSDTLQGFDRPPFSFKKQISKSQVNAKDYGYKFISVSDSRKLYLYYNSENGKKEIKKISENFKQFLHEPDHDTLIVSDSEIKDKYADSAGKDSNFYDVRGIQEDKHNEYFIHSKNFNQKIILDITNKIFKHQKAIYNIKNDKIDEYNSNNKETFIEDEWISAQFYKKYYVRPNLFSGKSESGTPLEMEDLIKAISTHTIARNHLFFLLGEVGAGKTALINYLISVHGQKLSANKILFVRYDVDLSLDNNVTLEKIMIGIFEKIIKILNKEELQQLQHINYMRTSDVFKKIKELFNSYHRNKHEINHTELTGIFREFILFAKKQDISILVIVDNIDFALTSKDIIRASDEVQSTLKSIFNFIYQFLFEKKELCNLGINILFSLRRDSYNFIRERLDKLFHLIPDLDLNKNAFTLKSPHWTDVIEKRISLLKNLVSFLDEKDQFLLIKVVFLYQSIIKQYKCSTDNKTNSYKITLHILLKISNFRLRNIVEFFCKYAWIKEKYNMYRYSYHAVGIIGYMLNGRKLYSQKFSRFPNIYLNKSLNDNSNPVNYWLKRYIVQFINLRCDSKLKMDIELLYNVFCNGKKSYSQKLVEDCLGSLANPHGSGLIRLNSLNSSNTTISIPSYISITDKGKYCNQNVYDSFLYLQLIVDDYMLQLPIFLIDHFCFDEYDYSYFVDDSSSYFDHSLIMIRKKIKQVLIFIEVLRYSQEYERHLYSNVYEQLDKYNLKKFNVDKIREEIDRDISYLDYHFKKQTEKDLLKVSEINEVVKKLQPEIKEKYKALIENNVVLV